MKLYHGEPAEPSGVQPLNPWSLPWGNASLMRPDVDGIYIALVEQAGALWPHWVARFQGEWVNCYDYEIEFSGKINFWIGPWSVLKFDS